MICLYVCHHHCRLHKNLQEESPERVFYSKSCFKTTKMAMRSEKLGYIPNNQICPLMCMCVISYIASPCLHKICSLQSSGKSLNTIIIVYVLAWSNGVVAYTVTITTLGLKSAKLGHPHFDKGKEFFYKSHLFYKSHMFVTGQLTCSMSMTTHEDSSNTHLALGLGREREGRREGRKNHGQG